MGLIRFYGLVLREAFRHSLDIAQAVIFVLLAFSGFIASRNPTVKPMLDAIDFGGWQIAAIVFGSIIVIRLLLAPYWLWKAAMGRIVSEPGNNLDWGFRHEGFHYMVDKKKKAIQVGFILQSTIALPIRYEVEDILVTIGAKGADTVNFDSMGAVVGKLGNRVFYYAWIFDVLPKKGVGQEGYASITFKYGKTDGPFARRAKYVCKLYNPGMPGAKFHTMEETETSI